MDNGNKKFIEGIHFYYNEDGNTVLTERYHLARGFCCGNGCLNCPYNYEMVAEPYRNTLLEKRKNGKEDKN
ncbi:MAG: DUF5522 domain-containing protein [Ginsengibacter sp.]